MPYYKDKEIEQVLDAVRTEFEHGGPHLGAVRRWMQQNFRNGETVQWGSRDEFLTGTSLTPFQMDQLATDVMTAIMLEVKQKVISGLQDWSMQYLAGMLLGTEAEMSDPSGRYDVFATQGQGGSIDASFDTLEEAVAFTDAHKGEANYAIRYPDGKWHEWVLAQPVELRNINDR